MNLSIAPSWDWTNFSILCFFLRFCQPDSNFLERFAEDMASIFEHNSSRCLDEKIKRTKFREIDPLLFITVWMNWKNKWLILPSGPQCLASRCRFRLPSVPHARCRSLVIRGRQPIRHQGDGGGRGRGDRDLTAANWDWQNKMMPTVQRPANKSFFIRPNCCCASCRNRLAS